MNKRKVVLGGILGFIGIVLLLSIGKMWENIGASEIVVIQNPFNGHLKVYTHSDFVWQGWGKVTRYKKSFQDFFEKPNSHDKGDHAIKVRFNDGGHADLSGSIRVDLPTDYENIIQLHTKYGSQEAIENQLVNQVIAKAVYMTGPMMSSKESYAEKRNDLISFIEDQAINGVYKTIVINTKVKDPMDTNVERTVGVVKVRTDERGVSLRQEESPTTHFGIRLYNLTIRSIDYDATVEKQIAAQQDAVMS